MMAQRVGLALLAGRAPGGDAVPAEDHPDRLRVLPRHRGDVQAELEPGPPPRHPPHPVPEAGPGQFLAVGRGGERDPGVRVQVIHVLRVHQSVHGRVDRRRRAPFAMQAVVEGRDHLVLALHPRIYPGQRAQPVQPQHGQPAGGQRAQVPAGPLDPQQPGRLAGHRVRHLALGRGVAARVVGVAGIRPEPVTALQQLTDFGRYLRGHVMTPSRRAVPAAVFVRVPLIAGPPCGRATGPASCPSWPGCRPRGRR